MPGTLSVLFLSLPLTCPWHWKAEVSGSRLRQQRETERNSYCDGAEFVHSHTARRSDLLSHWALPSLY